jgi:hypothetical protein
VVYGYLDARKQLGPECEIWFTKSAFEAAEILETRSEWRPAISLYKRVADAGLAASKEASDRLQKIRVEQLILF